MTRRVLLCILSLLLISGAPVFGGELESGGGFPCSADSILAFARKLAGEGEYYRAVTELKRFIFLYPEHAMRPAAERLLGLAYLDGGDYAQAALVFEDLARRYAKDLTGMKAAIDLARTRLAQGEKETSRKLLSSLLERSVPDEVKDEARIQISLSWMEEGRWAEAARELRMLSVNFEGERLASELEQGEDISERDPFFSGVLSAALPGLGQAYCERPRDAVVAFGLTGLFFWAGWEAWEEDLEVTAGLLGIVGLGWYLGNIYNAVSDAHLYNQRAREEFIIRWKDRVGLHLSGGGGRGALLGLVARF